MDKELLAAIGQLIDEKLKPIEQDIAEVKQEVVKTNLTIEHDIMKRLEVLMDGYELNYEATSRLKKRVEVLENGG